jgi:hypothetical protein
MVGLPGVPGMTAKFLIRHVFAPSGRQTTVFAAGKFHEWDPLEVEWRAVDDHAIRAVIYDAIKRYGKRPDKRHISAVLHSLKYELTWPAPPRIDVAA